MARLRLSAFYASEFVEPQTNVTQSESIRVLRWDSEKGFAQVQTQWGVQGFLPIARLLRLPVCVFLCLKKKKKGRRRKKPQEPEPEQVQEPK